MSGEEIWCYMFLQVFVPVVFLKLFFCTSQPLILDTWDFGHWTKQLGAAGTFFCLQANNASSKDENFGETKTEPHFEEFCPV